MKTKHIFDEQQAMMTALDISGNHVMCLDLQQNRVFDLHGKAIFGNNLGIEVCYTYIHPDDQDVFRTFIERLSDGTDKEAECRYRWNYNYTGQGDPDWHDMHGYAIAEYEDGKPVNIIATLTDETDLKRKEREVEQLYSRYKTIFENSIIGLSFYTPDGWLVDANRIMRKLCNFDSEEGDEFFSKMNLFDMSPFNEVLDHDHPDDYWACSLSIIPERNMHVYLEISVHPIYDEKNQLVYIAVSANDVTEEREMYLNVTENDVQMQKMNEAIKNYEAELRYMMESSKMQAWRISLDRNIIEFYSGLNTVVRSFDLLQMQKIFVDQEHPFVKAQSMSTLSETLSKPLIYRGQMYPVVSQSSTELQWVQVNGIPEYDKDGRLIGAFGIWRNINDIMHKQDQLRSETQRARESGQMKSLFLANMTHEIRTPINAIVGFSEVLSTLTSSEEKKEVIQIIKNNCDMLLRLVNDILTASSLETGKVSIQPVDVDFSKTFNELFESLRPRMQEPGVEFQKDNPYDTLPIKIDADRMSQVITNFVTNAVKYTHQGHIKLGYRKENRTVDGQQREGLYVYCEDTGDGVPQESQPKIFERFFKVNDFIQGTGLGLSICKAFADACHGDIGVISEGKGKGSTFWTWIPL
ncbi:MAG: PAS domain-containing sensor histidine kinase [Prevotella sp.]|nr:PAS domain-containing sensor histidine kinase [Prevotella sp.]MBR0262472.1 PAS domain-containing sensor histidine kinase [Prevotella sp.]